MIDPETLENEDLTAAEELKEYASVCKTGSQLMNERIDIFFKRKYTFVHIWFSNILFNFLHLGIYFICLILTRE